MRYVASQNLRRSYIWYTVDTDTDTVAEMTSSRAADRVGRFTYDHQWDRRVRKVMLAILKLIRCLMGSQ